MAKRHKPIVQLARVKKRNSHINSVRGNTAERDCIEVVAAGVAAGITAAVGDVVLLGVGGVGGGAVGGGMATGGDGTTGPLAIGTGTAADAVADAEEGKVDAGTFSFIFW